MEMRKPFLVLFLLLPVLTVVAQTNANPRLDVRLRSDYSSYHIDGTLSLEAIQANTGSTDFYIHRRWDWGISKIRVFDTKGREKTVGYAIDDPPPLAQSDFVLLNPGEFFGTVLQRPVRSLVDRPGDYEVFVEYKSYLSDDLVRKFLGRKDLRFWSKTQAAIVSNRIKLHID